MINVPSFKNFDFSSFSIGGYCYEIKFACTHSCREFGIGFGAHLLTAEISVLNGCPYCTYGHVYALQLHYYKDQARLMPVDEDEIVAWHAVSESDAIDRF